jgi:hypothetical protein
LQANLQLVRAAGATAVKRLGDGLRQSRFAGAVATQQADDVFGEFNFSLAKTAKVAPTEGMQDDEVEEGLSKSRRDD